MRFSRWTNPALPQTLQIAVFLLYIDAVIGLILGSLVTATFGLILGLGYLVACALSGLGIANEMRWGWNLGVAASVVGLVPYVLLLLGVGSGAATSGGFLLGLLIAVAQLALLLHPQSRDHQKIWFT
jgi:hypothetical protein